MAYSRNDVLAGGLLLGGVVIGVMVSFWLSGAAERLRPSRSFEAVFTIAEGAAGIREGSAVLVGGQPVGKVSNVELRAPDLALGDLGAPVAVHVRVRMRRDIPIFDDAEVLLDRPLLGSGGSINIASLGTPGTGPRFGPSGELLEGEAIRGRTAPPAPLAAAGFGAKQAESVQRIVANLDSVMADAAGFTKTQLPVVTETLADANSMLDDLRTSWAEWVSRVDRTLANVESASEGTPEVVEAAGGAMNDLRTLIADGQRIVRENEPKVTATINNVEQLTARLNGPTIEALDQRLVEARAAMAAINDSFTNLSGLIREQTPNVRRIMGNTRLATDQLKFATTEVRAQPWRLLYRPSPKESEEAVLYDTARSFATAVSDLRAASESMEAALGASNAPGEFRRRLIVSRSRIFDRVCARHSTGMKPRNRRFLRSWWRGSRTERRWDGGTSFRHDSRTPKA